LRLTHSLCFVACLQMYKIAGEMMPAVFHVAARALAGQALSIYGDHGDVMACRQTGFSLLSSDSVQEAHDMALISHIASLRSSMPFVHFFDGFRVSHETHKINMISDDIIKALVPWDKIQQHRDKGLNPTHPHLRGTSQVREGLWGWEDGAGGAEREGLWG
jgi:pyruvate-ferredoxin/flavodoxin oxidoreductase